MHALVCVDHGFDTLYLATYDEYEIAKEALDCAEKLQKTIKNEFHKYVWEYTQQLPIEKIKEMYPERSSNSSQQYLSNILQYEGDPKEDLYYDLICFTSSAIEKCPDYNPPYYPEFFRHHLSIVEIKDNQEFLNLMKG